LVFFVLDSLYISQVGLLRSVSVLCVGAIYVCLCVCC
jgi:hypothetical protein